MVPSDRNPCKNSPYLTNAVCSVETPFAGLLGAVESLVGPLEEDLGIVLGPELRETR